MAVISNLAVQYRIAKIHIDVNQLTMLLEIERGIAENGSWIVLNTFNVDVPTADTQALMSVEVTSGTVYDAIKTGLYGYLLDKEIISGEVE